MSAAALSSATASLERLAGALIRKRSSDPLRSLRRKSVAVASGKGGVGKTITASNLAVWCAQEGYPTALVDLDPLSDVAGLLDVVDAEAAMETSPPLSAESSLDDLTVGLFPNLDLVFPLQKTDASASHTLLRLLFHTHARELDARYRVLIYDLPAGIGFEDNLVYLPFAGSLVVVTNPDPLSHTSAGAYIRRVLQRYPDTRFSLWHNRYAEDPGSDFDPRDVIGTYNRNCPPTERIPTATAKRLTNVAFVPEDPALNLLLGHTSLSASGYRAIADTLRFIQTERVTAIAQNLMIPPKILDYVRHFIVNNPLVADVEDCLRELGDYLARVAHRRSGDGPDAPQGLEVFTHDERHTFHTLLLLVRKDSIRASATRVLDLLDERIEGLENSARAFYVQPPMKADKTLDREVGSLLVELRTASQSNSTMRNPSGLLLFYFSLCKILQSETVVSLTKGFVPSRTDPRGRTVRDRNRQIRHLIARDHEYSQRYFSLVKTIYPVVQKQLSSVVSALELQGLLFRNAEGKVARSAYVKLFTNFLHDTVHAGLSVVVGFEYRAASLAFEQAAGRLLSGIIGPGA